MKVTQLPAISRNNYQGERVPRISPPVLNHADGFDIKKILSRFETDDYILAGIILVLIFEGCDDYILLSALGYLFIMGFPLYQSRLPYLLFFIDLLIKKKKSTLLPIIHCIWLNMVMEVIKTAQVPQQTTSKVTKRRMP